MRFRHGGGRRLLDTAPAKGAPCTCPCPHKTGCNEKVLPMKTLPVPGKISAVALLVMAGAFLAPHTASAETRDIRASFSYYQSAPAEKIYSDFQRRAKHVCKETDLRPISLRRAEA